MFGDGAGSEVPLRGAAPGLLYFPKRNSDTDAPGRSSGDRYEMTLSETPREPISMIGGASASALGGELLVSVTEAAAKKVIELRSREGKADANLRLFVKAGG